MSMNNFVSDTNPHAYIPPTPKKNKNLGHYIMYPLAVFFGLVAGLSAGGANTVADDVVKPQPTVTVTAPAKVTPNTSKPAPTTTKPAISEDGTYEVGVDIKPGKYKTKGGELCYWARLKNLSGGLDAVISNHLGSGPQTITIKSTDKGFETTRCGTWVKVG